MATVEELDEQPERTLALVIDWCTGMRIEGRNPDVVIVRATRRMIKPSEDKRWMRFVEAVEKLADDFRQSEVEGVQDGKD